jgi:hypothetical protein
MENKEGNAMLAHLEGDLLTINGVPVGPFFGGTAPVRQEGILTQGDLITVTSDGIDLNALWEMFAESTMIYNEAMDDLIALLTYPVDIPIEPVVQIGEMTFEEASQMGVPRGAGMPIEVFQMGYDLRHYDKRNAFTWMFLADADARQVEAIHQAVLWADKQNVFKKIMEAIFDNRTRKANIRNQAYNVYPLYNADGVAPPKYKNNTFTSSHNHYVVSNNSVVDSSDLEDLMELIAEHGYSPQAGTSFLLLANKAETDAIRQFRRGVVNNNGISAGYDFIPGPTQPAMILPNAEGLLGFQPNPLFGNLPVIGSYGFWNVVEEDYIPPGYLLGVGFGGRFALTNPVGLRQHANPEMQGLRIIPGNYQRYPLIDGFYARSFGSGVRQRGGAAIMQIKASGSYVIPDVYKRGTGFTVQ